MPPVGFETTILAGERPQTYALERAATGTSIKTIYNSLNLVPKFEKGKLCDARSDKGIISSK